VDHLITATVVDGVLKPDTPLNLPTGTQVRLLVMEPAGEWSIEEAQKAWDEFDRLCDEHPIHTGGIRMTRDQLHERH
jgi:predicted DNA-binding antitoxin AbrB/MazE fold protein